ncbi:MAG: hypothetical protein N3C60_05910 [Calditerrivibrio sp.]|nr:hypothetical protein [Calditerrivibrio sp.]
MHQGCSGNFENGKEVVDKLRLMGFNNQFMSSPFEVECECGEHFLMETFEARCPKCSMVYGVTPCHAFDKKYVQKAGIDY